MMTCGVIKRQGVSFFKAFQIGLWLLVFSQPMLLAQENDLIAPGRDLEKSADVLFLEAQKLFQDGKYWECARDLIILMDFHPDYSKIDQVVYLLGDCLYENGILDGSSKIYQYMLKKFIRSPLLPLALLGLQKIEYDKENLLKSLDFHETLQRGNPSREVLDVSRYFAARCHYAFQDYPQTISLLREIDSKSPYYDYGLYTMGLAQLRLKKVQDAIVSFLKICRLPVLNDERRALIDETRLTLGYLYYELEYYPNAYRELLLVSPDHASYQDALLAAGWSAVRQGDYQLAITPLTELIGKFSDSDDTQEGMFLLGRCFMKLEKYDQAIATYQHLIDLYPKQDLLPQSVENLRKNFQNEAAKIETIKMDLLVMETRLMDALALSEENNRSKGLDEEKQRLSEIREGIFRQIQSERLVFTQLSEQMEKMHETVTRREKYRDWRAYAEYGKLRATFLQRMQAQNNAVGTAPQ